MCNGSTGLTKQDPPLLYNLNADPGELNPLDVAKSPYNEILAKIDLVGLMFVYTYFRLISAYILC